MDAAMPDAVPNTSVQASGTGVDRDIDIPKDRAANNDTRGDVMLDTAPNDFGTPAYKEKGKGNETSFEPCPPNTDGRLVALPAELIASILWYLSPIDLDNVSETCRALNIHATADNLWQAHVQDNVPGVRVTSSYPCPSFRHLFRAHHLRWFLPKYKIWFADTNLPGRLVLVRYDQRRGCIEGYQVVAYNRHKAFLNWDADWEVRISTFDPQVNLHLDHPILRLPADPLSGVDKPRTEGAITAITLRRQSADGGDASHTVASSSRPKTDQRRTGRRFRAEVPMEISPIETLHVNFMHARILEPEDAANRMSSPFPYGNVWPPPAFPTSQRVLSNRQRDFAPLAPKSRPSCWQELSDRAFRIRKWLTLGITREHEEFYRINRLERQLFGAPTGNLVHPRIVISEGSDDEEPVLDIANPEDVLPVGARLAEEISTYATLDPELYTPTPTKPYRGIWVGDYGLHGCEFLWIHQPDDGEDAADEEDSGDIPRHEDESDEAYARRRYDATVHRGRLEAVKLTGDANVPRGELSWVVDDLGEGGLVRIAAEAPFQGARVVRSRGHIADEGFRYEGYIDDTQLILISPDRLAHNWASLGRVAYFHRVNIDELLVPR